MKERPGCRRLAWIASRDQGSGWREESRQNFDMHEYEGFITARTRKGKIHGVRTKEESERAREGRQEERRRVQGEQEESRSRGRERSE